MGKNQSNYSVWTWVIALLLALVLLLLLLTSKENKGCCYGAKVAAPLVEQPVEVSSGSSPIVTEAFNFSASANSLTNSGDASSIAWFTNTSGLNALLGSNLKAEGDDRSITLTGTVSSEAEKQQISLDAQAFFGEDVTINNQTTVTADTVSMAPPLAKVFFESGFHRLPKDGASILEPSIVFLQNNPDKKAIISGYHDATGVLANNQTLAKKRAQSVYDVLIAANIDANNIEMRKPISTDGGGDLKEARRVEVSIE